jgi:hypothetical protein
MTTSVGAVKSFIDEICNPLLLDNSSVSARTNQLKDLLFANMATVKMREAQIPLDTIRQYTAVYLSQDFHDLEARLDHVLMMAYRFADEAEERSVPSLSLPSLGINPADIDTSLLLGDKVRIDGRLCRPSIKGIIYNPDGTVNQVHSFYAVGSEASDLQKMQHATRFLNEKELRGMDSLMDIFLDELEPIVGSPSQDRILPYLESLRSYSCQEIGQGLYLGCVASTREVGPIGSSKRFQFNVHVNANQFSLLSGRTGLDGAVIVGSIGTNNQIPGLLTTFISGDPTTEQGKIEYLRKLSGEGFSIEDPLTWFEKAFREIDRARAEGKNVLVSCSEGMSRSATLMIAYLMSRAELSFEQAVCHVRSRRPMIGPKQPLLNLLQEYDRALQLQRGVVAVSARALAVAAAGGAEEPEVEIPRGIDDLTAARILSCYLPSSAADALVELARWVGLGWTSGAPCVYDQSIHRLFDHVNRTFGIGFKERIFNELYRETGVDTTRDVTLPFTPVALDLDALTEAFKTAWNELIAQKGNSPLLSSELFQY